MLRRDTPPWRFVEIAHTFPRLARLPFGGTSAYLVTHPDLVRDVLVVQSKLVEKGPALKGAGLVLGDGLLTMAGDRHRARRRLVNPAFHHSRLAGYAETMTAATVEFEQRWTAGRRVDMSAEMAALTLDIVGRALFGAELGDEADQVYDDMGQAMSGWEKMMLPGGVRLVKLPIPAFKRMWAGADGLDAVVRRLIAASAERKNSPIHGVDVVGDLLDAEIDGERLPAEAVRDEAMTLLLAGHETTANLLTWAWHLLSRHPEAAARLRREVAGLGHPPSFGDLRAMPWAYAVVAEVLRLFPPAWVLEREVTEDLVLDGWTIPKGSIVLASQFALHRDARFWDEPAAFRPARWLAPDGSFSEDAPGQPRGAWFPFGAGTRVCVGESFAWTEAVLVLATLAARWAPVTDPSWRERLHAAVTLRPHGGLPMTLQAAH
ncbi:MAG: cytochrome P450 [Mycobacteriales bacterium]